MRIILRVLFSLIVLLALLFGALFLLPADKIAGLAKDQIHAATGRTLTLEGRLRPAIWPQLGLATGAVSLSNADWAGPDPMIRAEGLSVGLDWGALIGGDLRVTEVTLTAPQILLERGKDGADNWTFGSGTATPGASTDPAAPPAIAIDRAAITGGTVVYLDHASGETRRIEGIDATLNLPEPGGPAELRLAAQLNGQTATARLSLPDSGALLAGQVAPLETEITLGAARLTSTGRAGLAPLAAELAVDAELSDLTALFAALGLEAPALPAGVGERLTFTGQVTLAPEGSVHLRDAVLTQDANRLTGAADLFLDGPRPRLNGQFTAGALNLAAFTGESGGSGGAQDPGWPKDPIDASALATLDAEIALTADSLDLGAAQLGRSVVLATIEDRRLQLDLRQVQAYGGTVTGSVAVNGRDGLSVGSTLTVAGLALEPALKTFADYDRLSGTADLSLSVLGSGNSVDAIMKSLSGSGKLALGKGEMRGLDIVGMLRTLDTSYVGTGAKTIYDSIGASFTIDKGVLTNNDLAFTAPLLRMAGKGTVGLGAQRLDYKLTPTALADAEGKGGVKVPLLIKGAWSNPKISLDLAGLAADELGLEEKKKQLEDQAEAAADKAREDLKAKAAKELGAKTDEGESLEDAAKRKLEDEAKKGLKGLLGGN